MKLRLLVLTLTACAVILSSCSSPETLENGMSLGFWKSEDGSYILGLKGDQRVMWAGTYGTYSELEDGTIRIVGFSGVPMHVTIQLDETRHRVLVDDDIDYFNNAVLDLIAADNGPDRVQQGDLLGTWVHTDDHNDNCAFNRPPVNCLDTSMRMIFENDGGFRMENAQSIATQEYLNFEGTFELFDGKLLLNFEELGNEVYDQIFHFGNVMVLDGYLVMVKVSP